MTARLRTSSAGLELIKSFEGFRDVAVRLPDGRWTIGHGHVRTAREGLIISAADAELLLVYDLQPIEAAISTLVFAPLNQNQFDALVSLTYNISPGQFRDSEILGYLNAGDFLSAANGFDLWRKARIHGRVMVVDALVRRRAAEKAMFLEHPDGRPTAPTPMVTPTRDTGSDDAAPAPRMTAPTPGPTSSLTANEGAPREGTGRPRPVTRMVSPPRAAEMPEQIDIAEAVRRLAERTNEIMNATHPAAAAPPQPLTPRFAATPEPVVEPEAEAPAVAHTPPRTVDEIDDARRAVAERVARILERTERAIAEQQPEPVAQPAAQPVVQPAIKPAPVQATASQPAPTAPVGSPRPTVRAAAQPAPEKITRDIPEDLPDFDKPAEPRIRASSPTSSPVPGNGRKLIDDTEIVEPGVDPAKLFAEAEKKAQIVNGRAKKLGLINGRWVVLLPWIGILALSVLGFVIGLFNTFGDTAQDISVVRGSATVLAVFGMMMLMSLYFMITRASDTEG